jgi:hypothetical protein
MRRRLFKRHTDVCQGLPSNPAFSQRAACIKGKVEFNGQVRSAWELQAGTMIAQIADDARQYRMVSQHESGSLEYDRPLNTTTLEHDLCSNPQFDENHPILNKLPNGKLDRSRSANLRKP